MLPWGLPPLRKRRSEIVLPILTLMERLVRNALTRLREVPEAPSLETWAMNLLWFSRLNAFSKSTPRRIAALPWSMPLSISVLWC